MLDAVLLHGDAREVRHRDVVERGRAQLGVERGLSREAFGKPLISLGKNPEIVARARIDAAQPDADSRGAAAFGDDRSGADRRENRGGYQPRDDRGGYQRRDDRGVRSDRGGYQRRDDRGGYQRRDDRGNDRRDDRGGYQRRDDRGSDRRDDRGGYQRRDDRGGYQRPDDRGGYQRREEREGYARTEHTWRARQDEREGRPYERGRHEGRSWDDNRRRDDRRWERQDDRRRSFAPDHEQPGGFEDAEAERDAADAAYQERQAAGLVEDATAQVSEDNGFATFGLHEDLVAALARVGITQPFPIQTATIPDALAGRDLLGRGQTGSGKTMAFGLPLLHRLTGRPRAVPHRPRALILSPTRELAMQSVDALAPLMRAVGKRFLLVAGGMSYAPQLNALDKGVDVLVATPGRLIDLIERGAADLSEVEVGEPATLIGTELGLEPLGCVASPLPGPSGNVEYFLHLRRTRTGEPVEMTEEAENAIRIAVEEGPQ